MAYITVEDFYSRASACTVLSRQEEKDCAERMKQGDETARKQLIESYMPMVAAIVKRTNNIENKLALALYCLDALEKAVDRFNFMQESESFTHHLSWCMRQTVTAYRAR